MIAVHGVAYHAPGASADAVSGLVLGLSEGDIGAKYGPLEEETVHIPLKPLSVIHLTQPPIGGPLSRFLDRFRERTVYLTRSWRNAEKINQAADKNADEKAAKEESLDPASGGQSSQSSEGGLPGPFRKVTNFLARSRTSAQVKRKPRGRNPDDKVANDFMCLLLQNYRGSEGKDNQPKDERDATAYVTTRLQGKRTWKDNTGADQAIDVHFYEMYWADLSRPNQTVLSFFQALYQLLFHLASLSRLVISTAYENRNDWLWRALDWTQGWAVRMLGLPIPILNVLLLISILGALPHLIPLETPDSTARQAAIWGAAFLGLLIYAVLERKLPATKWPWTWILFPLVFVLPLAVIAALFAGDAHELARKLLAFEGLLLGSVALYLSVDSYDEVRDGAWETALGLWVPWILLILGLFWGYPDKPVDQITVWVMQIVLAALRITWALLFCFAFVAFVLGGWSWRKIRREEKKNGDPNRYARARAAVRTSRLALALPTMGVLIVTLALFSILFVQAVGKAETSFSIAKKLFGNEISEPLSPYGHWLSGRYLSLIILGQSDARPFVNEQMRQRSMSPNQYFKGVLVWSASPAFPIILALLLYGLLLMALWLIPSIYSEMQPPRCSDNRSSERMGNWLSRGLDASKINTLIMWAAAFAAPPVLVALGWLATRSGPRELAKRIIHGVSSQTPHLLLAAILLRLNGLTATILLSMGAVAGSLTILASLAKSGSSALGIILDVDNYLRAAPKDATPRARIMERYVSLLHYLWEYRDPRDGAGYDHVVVVAHSLGALISVDLLHFLKVQDEPPKIPLRLFTMGNPLRQLLNRFFPYLYEWVHPLPDNSVTPLENTGQTKPEIDGHELPDPFALGVNRWMNAYRSGDYVGRSVWLNEWYDREVPARVDPNKRGPVYVATENSPGPREEMCIGAGAHQHYWDESAPDIAKKLDELIWK